MRDPAEKSPCSQQIIPDRSIDARFGSVYQELRRIAYRLKQQDSSLTLNPTALVHEAYIQLASSDRAAFASPAHFWNTVVLAMRHTLVDAARRRIAERRGGGAAPLSVEELTEASAPFALDTPEQFLDIDLALERLAGEDQVLARVFEYHFFAGFTQTEIAAHLGLSEKIVRNRLRLAKARLAVDLAGRRGLRAAGE
jgi:RNA polymerase sigma factor (TIGR02999 family)